MLEINDFCIKSCPSGLKKSEELLYNNESVFDAALDMHLYVEKCIKTCPYKDKLKASEVD